MNSKGNLQMWPYYPVSKLPLWCILFFFFFGSTTWWTWDPCSGSTESYPLDHQGGSHSDEFLRLFLTSYGGGRKFSREVPSPCLVGRFTETARVTQSNSTQIPLTTIEQNLSQVLSSEESTESHWACVKRKSHTTPGSTLLTRPQTTDLSLCLPFLSSFPTISYTPLRSWY